MHHSDEVLSLQKLTFFNYDVDFEFLFKIDITGSDDTKIGDVQGDSNSNDCLIECISILGTGKMPFSCSKCK